MTSNDNLTPEKLAEILETHPPMPSEELRLLLAYVLKMHVDQEAQVHGPHPPMIPVSICFLVTVLHELVYRRVGDGELELRPAPQEVLQ